MPLGNSEMSILIEIAHCMSIGEFERQQRHFQFPFPVFYGGDLRVVTNPSDAAAGTREYLADLAANGVSKVTVGVIETLSETEDRCCLRAIWSYEDGLGIVVAATQNDIYFDRKKDEEAKIIQIDIHVSSNAALRKNFKVKDVSFDA